MSTPRLLSRIPSAKAISVAYLKNHRLKFHKISKHGSGKCDVELSSNSSDVVYGVLFQMLASEKPVLDKIEGLGDGYREKIVSVVGSNGKSFKTVTYFATHINPSLKPYDWYKEHVLRGAREHCLPSEYIRSIETVESKPDPDPKNKEKELAIYL